MDKAENIKSLEYNEEFTSKILKSIEDLDKVKADLQSIYEKLELTKAEIKNDKLEYEKHLKNFIAELKDTISENHEKINKLNTDLQSIKEEKLETENRLETVEEMCKDEIGKMKSNYEKEIQLIKTENEELDGNMQIGTRNIWNKIDKSDLELKKIKPEFNEKIETFNVKFDEIESKITEVKKRTVNIPIIQRKIDQIERSNENKMSGIFEMIIDKVDDCRENNREMWSECINVAMYPYKIRLHISFYGKECNPPSNGSRSLGCSSRFKRSSFLFDSLCIQFCIFDNVMNQYLPFPFKADITMKIINKNKREIKITKKCQIKKPKNNSYNASDDFIYLFTELTKRGILESNCVILQCCVEMR